MVRIELPYDNENEDWIKTLKWDLPDDIEPEALERMAKPMTLAEFLSSPAAEPMPRELRKKCLKYLRAKALLTTD